MVGFLGRGAALAGRQAARTHRDEDAKGQETERVLHENRWTSRFRRRALWKLLQFRETIEQPGTVVSLVGELIILWAGEWACGAGRFAT